MGGLILIFTRIFICWASCNLGWWNEAVTVFWYWFQETLSRTTDRGGGRAIMANWPTWREFTTSTTWHYALHAWSIFCTKERTGQPKPLFWSRSSGIDRETRTENISQIHWRHLKEQSWWLERKEIQAKGCNSAGESRSMICETFRLYQSKCPDS